MEPKTVKVTAGMKGSAFALGQWFTEGRPADEFAREELLGKAFQATAFGVHKDAVIMRVPGGRMIAEKRTVQGAPIVFFEYCEDGRWGKTTFWFNASSVSNLGDHLRAHPELRVSFDSIFVEEVR